MKIILSTVQETIFTACCIIVSVCCLTIASSEIYNIYQDYKNTKVDNMYSFELSENLLEYYYHSQDVFNDIDNFDDLYGGTDAACDMFDNKVKIDSLLK